MQSGTEKTNGNAGERLVQYLARNGGQARRGQLQRSRILRGSPESYDATLASLIAEGVIVCESAGKKTETLYKLAQPVEAPETGTDADGKQTVTLAEVKQQISQEVCPEPETEVAEEFSSKKMLVTPEMAMAMLAQNRNNRPIRQANVNVLVAAIQHGHWVMTGNPIAFDKHGRLLDGQHRLMAIIEAGQAVESVVTRGLEIDAFLTTDIGAKRGAADVAAMLGFKCYVTTGCAATLLHHYENNSMRIFKKGVTNKEVEKILREHPDLDESVAVGRELGNILPPGIGAFCHYIFHRLDRKAADSFFQQLKTGANLKPRSPILILRDKLLFCRSSKAFLSRQAIAALTIKAWNFFRKGREVANVSWKPREHFPQAL